jgi:hypothetical protein
MYGYPIPTMPVFANTYESALQKGYQPCRLFIIFTLMLLIFLKSLQGFLASSLQKLSMSHVSVSEKMDISHSMIHQLNSPQRNHISLFNSMRLVGNSRWGKDGSKISLRCHSRLFP